jgi:hypothetical protein
MRLGECYVHCWAFVLALLMILLKKWDGFIC